ncbi:MAG: hypothetical protein IJ168_04135 [Eubacterium sp.]|nr:hypothetical protein [Eubacterium sp.]
MKKISQHEITDVVRYADDKIIIVEKIPAALTKPNANYYVLNLKTFEKEAVTKSVYLMKKFGASSYQKITEQLTAVPQCDAVILPSREVFVLFPNGQCGLFSSYGELQWNKTLSYNDKEVHSLAYENGYLWCCCTEENCVIRYAADNFKVDLRIGGKEADTFRSPTFVSSDGEGIYVCCEGKRLRKIDLTDLTVSDVSDGIPQLTRFYRFGKISLLCTANGAYIGEDE